MIARRGKYSVKPFLLTAVIILSSVFSYIQFIPEAHAYPDAEIVWDYGGGPPFDFGITSTPSGFVLMSDTEIAISSGKVLKLIDAGSFYEETDQPFDISSDEDTNSVIIAIAYVGFTEEIATSQEDGTLLAFPLSDITSKPNFMVVEEGSELGPIAVDTINSYVFVADNSSRLIHVIDLLTMELLTSYTLTITGKTSFSITDAHFVPTTGEAYFTTDVGGVFYLTFDATEAILIDVDLTNEASLSALDQLPGGSLLYVVDSSFSGVSTIDTSSHSVDNPFIDLAPNSSLSDIVIASVTNPSGTYAYVPGASGMSVINTATDTVIDFGDDPGVDGEPMPTSAQPLLVQASSVDDGFVYTIFSTGGFGVISENPFVAISSLTYSNGGSTLGAGESFTLTFAANQAGTYEIMVGGSVDASGTLLSDSAGATSGAVEVDTDKAVTINYDDNADHLGEGTNTIWVFVTADSGRGRLSTEVTVDTPPPDVVIKSTGFGNEKVYVNFERIDVEDMATYNVYADTDPDAVITKGDVSVEVSQPSSGDTVTAAVDGLINGTLYYFAMEAVDSNGNMSPNRTYTLSDGSRVTGMPEQTEGPAGISGEKGCSLMPVRKGCSPWAFLPLFFLLPMLAFRRSLRTSAICLILMIALFLPSASFAQNPGEGVEVEVKDIPTGWELIKNEPAKWTIEAKTGFWMPKSSALDPFYNNCCNMWTRFQVGYMFQHKYGMEFGVGFHYKSGTAVGSTSGTASQDKYSFLLVPLEMSGVWRIDYSSSWRYIIPYLKAGFNGVIFRESTAGTSVFGVKWGVHGTGGLQFNLGMIGDTRTSLAHIGIKDFFLTMEGEYQWVNNFGGKGLDLTGPILSIGFLFYF